MQIFRWAKAPAPLGGNPTPPHTECKEERRYSLSDFSVLDTLGVGTFGKVRLVHHVQENVYYALKIVNKTQGLGKEHWKREGQLLWLVNHPFIVILHARFRDELREYMLMEPLLGGEVFRLLRKSKFFPNNQAMYYAAEVTIALEYLHSLNVIYRGLKPENILLGCDGNVKLVDFGFAKHVVVRTYTLCGTPEYVAPEVLTNLGYGKSVDWWALGIFIFEMLVGHTPFRDSTPFAIYEKVLSGKFDLPRTIDAKGRNLLKRLVHRDRTKRLGCRSGEHIFFFGAYINSTVCVAF